MKRTIIGLAVAAALVSLAALLRPEPILSQAKEFDLSGYAKRQSEEAGMGNRTEGLEQATLGGGCFWCVEAVFERIEGVVDAVSGYAGGSSANPTYEQVSSGRSGHAEVVQVTFDPDKITYERILEIFFKSHDPTTRNRQGADVGTQYRSVIYYHDEQQREAAAAAKSRAGALYNDPIVTEISPLPVFYRAEGYHQDYFANNPFAGYCRVVIAPKLGKLGLDEAATF